jgi:glutamyl-tRNA reductase
MSLTIVGINHKSAPVELRERVAFADADLGAALQSLKNEAGTAEALILSTCNRTEIYCSGDESTSSTAPIDWLLRWHTLDRRLLAPAVYTHQEGHAVQHAIRVACGLDSLVLGEPQILGQMKQAYTIAHTCGASGKLLNRLFQHAFAAAKRVRSDTGIGHSPVSVAYAAARLAEQIFGSLEARTALIIGAGETSELLARHLHRNGLRRLVIANRRRERALDLASRFRAEAISLAEMPGFLHEADIVVSATASKLPILGKGAVERALRLRRHQPMFLIDLAIPRDMEPEIAELADVYLYTVDDLESVVAENLKSRQQAALAAEEIIDAEVRAFIEWRQSLDAVGTIRDWRAALDRTRVELVERAHRQLVRGDDPHGVIEGLATALTNRISHVPKVRLREAAQAGREDVIRTARSLLGLDAAGELNDDDTSQT